MIVSDAFVAVGVNWQLPDPLASVTVQAAPVASFTATEPVGTPLTPGTTVTVAVTGTPTGAGFGEAVIVTVVFSVNTTLNDWLAVWAGGPGSFTVTLKEYVPGTPF